MFSSVVNGSLWTAGILKVSDPLIRPKLSKSARREFVLCPAMRHTADTTREEAILVSVMDVF
jgi:hypothetical protein